jgi:hypothetical protein
MTERLHDWRHAVTFNRRYSTEDENLVRELLLEWAYARGLKWVYDDAPTVAMMQLFGIGAKVHVERDNYDSWAGYAMEFVNADPGTYTHALDNFPQPERETRLKGVGLPAGMVLRGNEELYELPPADNG